MYNVPVTRSVSHSLFPEPLPSPSEPCHKEDKGRGNTDSLRENVLRVCLRLSSSQWLRRVWFGLAVEGENYADLLDCIFLRWWDSWRRKNRVVWRIKLDFTSRDLYEYSRRYLVILCPLTSFSYPNQSVGAGGIELRGVWAWVLRVTISISIVRDIFGVFRLMGVYFPILTRILTLKE